MGGGGGGGVFVCLPFYVAQSRPKYFLFSLCLLGFLTAILQTHARERNVPVDSLSFCYQVLKEKWTNDERVHSESNVDFKRVAFQVRFLKYN